jgi:hypothetical protein
MLIGVAVFEANLGGIMAGETPEILVLFYSACIMWFLVTLVTGLIAGWKLLSGVREFNKAKTSRRGEIR